MSEKQQKSKSRPGALVWQQNCNTLNSKYHQILHLQHSVTIWKFSLQKQIKHALPQNHFKASSFTTTEDSKNLTWTGIKLTFVIMCR